MQNYNIRLATPKDIQRINELFIQMIQYAKRSK